jgi:hypothetical protein
MLFAQSLKRCITDKSISILKIICTVVHMNLARTNVVSFVDGIGTEDAMFITFPIPPN